MVISSRRERASRQQPEQEVSDPRWSSPPPAQEDGPEVNENEEVQEELKPAPFVRIVTHVGKYPVGSIVPTVTFEYLDNLLKLGAVQYDYTATEAYNTGDSDYQALTSAQAVAAVQTIPPAPWINASPANLLGAKYVPVGLTAQQWFKPPTVVAENSETSVDQPVDSPVTKTNF